jgi:hypothetical protein
MNLILDIKKLIAITDYETWLRLCMIDEEFDLYSRTDDGIRYFISVFWIMDEYPDKEEHRIFDKYHSFYDEPALILFKNGTTKVWYQNGVIHRGDDLPSVISNGEYNAWYKDGMRHRDDNKPAVMCSDGYKGWWYNDVLMREEIP